MKLSQGQIRKPKSLKKQAFYRLPNIQITLRQKLTLGKNII